MEYVNGIETAPQAVGPYSQAVKTDGFVFLSGQIPLDPKTGKLVEGGIEAQTRQVLANIKAVLAHLSLSFDRVAKTTIFLTDLSHFKTVNEIYAATLGQARPARSTIQVAALPLGASIEIEMVASVR